MRRLAPTAAARVLPIPLALLALGGVAAPARAQDPAPVTSPVPAPATAPNPWRLGDDIGERMNARWNPARGVYMNEHGFPDTRLNALMLQLMSMAALAGHDGPIRHDDRIEPMVKVLTSPPVLVARSLRPRQIGHIPHSPAWTPSIGEDPEQAVLHPSIDTAVVRALTAAWRARDIIHMAPETTSRIGVTLIQLASSPFYQGDSRALNQINWQAEVYSAALEVAGDRDVLPEYREQLAWFADYAHTPDPKSPGGSPNLTSGGGFRYLPNRSRTAQLNRVEATEYGNLALGALGFYQQAVRAGMQPLSAKQLKTLQGWARHELLGSWTHAGYPNWDTGLGTKRRHLRQYWAWSLDGLMTASSNDSLLGYPKQRAYARYIAQQGIALYLSTAWTPQMDAPDGPLPGKTSFDAPNGFTTGAGNELIGPLRFAVLDASLDGRFQDIAPAEPPNWYAGDAETGRFTFSTPYYNGAILPTRAGQSQGGVEPVRLFDGKMRPLTGLGGRGNGSFGLSVLSGGRVALDTEPATPTRQRTRDIQLVGHPADTAASFGRSVDVLGRLSSGAGRIELRHRLSTTGLRTTYRASNLATGSRLAIRIPVWGQDARLRVNRGAVLLGGKWVRTSTSLQLEATTADGGDFTVTLAGIPKNAQLTFLTLRPDSFHPHGAKQAVIEFGRPKSGTAKITRDITVKAP